MPDAHQRATDDDRNREPAEQTPSSNLNADDGETGATDEHTRTLRSADKLTDRNVRTIIDLERQAKSAMTLAERVSARVSASVGTVTFLLSHVTVFGGWILFNSQPIFGRPLDPFPFPVLALFVALEAIILSSIILIGQNHERRATEQRSHLDLQINLLIEQENTRMLKMLRSIANKVGADIDDDEHQSALEESTHPERLLDQIDRATAEASRGPT